MRPHATTENGSGKGLELVPFHKNPWIQAYNPPKRISQDRGKEIWRRRGIPGSSKQGENPGKKAQGKGENVVGEEEDDVDRSKDDKENKRTRGKKQVDDMGKQKDVEASVVADVGAFNAANTSHDVFPLDDVPHQARAGLEFKFGMAADALNAIGVKVQHSLVPKSADLTLQKETEDSNDHISNSSQGLVSFVQDSRSSPQEECQGAESTNIEAKIGEAQEEVEKVELLAQQQETIQNVRQSNGPVSFDPEDGTMAHRSTASVADKHLQRTVELLQKNNVGVVIRDERELNAIRIREVELRQHRNGGVVIRDEFELRNRQEERNVEAKVAEKRKANSIGKGKHKSTCSNNGKENALALNDNVISKATLAQRVRRDREKRLKQCIAIPLGQRLRVDPPQKRQCLQSVQQITSFTTASRRHPTCSEQGTVSTNGTDPAQKRQRVTHIVSTNLANIVTEPASYLPETRNNSTCLMSLPSRSSAPQRNWSTPTSQIFQEDLSCGVNIENIPTSSRVHSLTHINLGRHYLGKMDILCSHCQALHWMEEKLARSSKKNPLFGTCCLQGTVKLHLLSTPPPPLKALYDGDDVRSKSFRSNTRDYNAANAFTSLGTTLDPRVLSGRGPTPFTIHGELRHRTGSLLPQAGQIGSYAQLYIYDPNSALDIRSRRNPQLRKDVLETIQGSLLEINAFVGKFRQAYAVLNQLAETGQNLPAHLHYSSSTDRRRYNQPTTDEIAVVVPGDGTKASGMRDIILHLRGDNGLMRINECHPAYLPLHYVLLFPYGELGWEPEMKNYRLFERPNEYSTILRSGKLFQEFLVDAWAATEQNRLTYYKLNQDKFRTALYQDFTGIHPDELNPNQIGKRFILPSSFVGGPRHMFEIFQDSMAITRYNQHPDIFLTMTAKPNWPEITSALLPHQKPTDRPDLVARVFELKRKALMKEIETNKVFGKKVAHVYTIEFQKRGLPHMHALLFLEGPYTIRTSAQVDNLICAEFPDPNDEPALFETVKSCMVHGPCGARNPNASCMENGKCTKRYPRAFAESTTMDQDGYPIYRHRSDGKVYVVRGHEVDNRDVVPYNPYLSKRFNCHINVEVCAGMRCVKYIHKYIYKGYDRTTMVLGSANEIQQYLDARYIGPPEAAWRIFGQHMHEELPTVTRLTIHLPGMHQFVYNPADSPETIRNRAAQEVSTLTRFFSWYASNKDAEKYTYQEFPQYFVWKSNQYWSPRVMGYAIGRMYFASPNCGELFYLRLLLTVVKGPDSYESLRTVNNVLYGSFKLACVARGLLEDDEEWIQCLQEASVMKTGYQLRRLFGVILTQCSPLNPCALWKQFCIHNAMILRIRFVHYFPLPTQPRLKLKIMVCIFWTNCSKNQIEAQEVGIQTNIERLNNGQRAAYDAITSSIFENKGTTFFLHGGAGTGKTFLYNTIAVKCRSLGHIVVTVASSGIASLLLLGGRTAHSTFRIPLDVLENSVCGFSKNSLQAELFRETKLIIWDEVAMQHKYCVEAVDRSLRDICDNEKPFGGITVVLGGDFRQVLPVVGTNPQEIVHLPPTIRKCQDLTELLSTVYPQLEIQTTSTPTYLTERSILSARNEDVNAINAAALHVFPGDVFTYLAADKLSKDDELDRSITNRYPNEYLNSLDPPGLPSFRVELKVGCPIMLLRNISPKNGLCNGTRMMVVRCGTRIIEAKILTGEKSGNLEFIPRISLTPSSSEFPFRMTRRQFPVRLAYAMTINKSQGQSVKFVGVDLRTPVFSHGQLYVALSRCTSFDRISVLLPGDETDTTTIVDWEEKAVELKRINSTRLRHWLSNSIVVHALNWYIEVDTQTFWRVMERKFKPLNTRGV
ncbi:hypothetical protein RHGRI_004335 [Rhododendron griersonianum]|uniref:ATP-dependent DNA helicase n=1 Tax=Rhododendron griersonianum TaxID=479676 RepID=A0AAV6LB64_9ERIC|nr:hypothetical protein RHGRI_004335 [Rhododendron griersonianum]